MDREQNRAIRNWARGQGMTVNDRGRIPREVTEAYHRAHQPQLVTLGLPLASGSRRFGCRRRSVVELRRCSVPVPNAIPGGDELRRRPAQLLTRASVTAVIR